MRKALVVGVDEYAFSPLGCCVNDATEVANVLREHANGDVNFDVALRKNTKTKAELVVALRKLFEGDGDIALFYFAGHGALVGSDGYIVLPDYKTGDEGVRVSLILEMANKSRFDSKIIVLDCCHAGSIVAPDPNLSCIAPLGKGVVVLSACSEDQSAREMSGHGVFTKQFIEAMNGGASNVLGEITPSQVYACIDKILGPWEQRPLFAANVSRHIVIKKSSPAIDVNILRLVPSLFVKSDSLYRLDPSFEPTNVKGSEHKNYPPYANGQNCKKFAMLQALVRVGLVVPEGEEHMYFAAMNSKACKLTPAGEYYWSLAKKKRI